MAGGVNHLNFDMIQHASRSITGSQKGAIENDVMVLIVTFYSPTRFVC